MDTDYFLETLSQCVVYRRLTLANNLSYPEISKQVLRHVSDRTGIISFANFPLIWLFGMRNNLVLWLTGWDFGTFNNFHRWIARIATLQAVIHSIGYTILILQRKSDKTQTRWKLGANVAKRADGVTSSGGGHLCSGGLASW